MQSREHYIYIVAPIKSADLNNFQPKNRVAGKFFSDEYKLLEHLKKLDEQASVAIYRVSCNDDDHRRFQEVLQYNEKANIAGNNCAYKTYSKSQRNNMDYKNFDPKAPAAYRTNTSAANVASHSATLFHAEPPSDTNAEFKLAMHDPKAAVRLQQDEVFVNAITPLQHAKIASQHTNDPTYRQAIASLQLHENAQLRYVLQRGIRRNVDKEEQQQIREIFKSDSMQKLVKLERDAAYQAPAAQPDPDQAPPAQPDPYEVLGVARDASQEEIKQAYSRLCRQYHSVFVGDKADMHAYSQVRRAYESFKNYELKNTTDDASQSEQSQSTVVPKKR